MGNKQSLGRWKKNITLWTNGGGEIIYYYSELKNTLNMTEDILRMKLKVDILSWRIQIVCRLGKERGGRLIVVRFISFLKKLQVLHAPRNLAGIKIRIEQDYEAKVVEISRLIPYLRLQTTEKCNIPS